MYGNQSSAPPLILGLKPTTQTLSWVLFQGNMSTPTFKTLFLVLFLWADVGSDVVLLGLRSQEVIIPSYTVTVLEGSDEFMS